MPAPHIASQIRESLADGERFDDFAYLFDTLMLFRRPYHENQKISENVGGRLLCLFVPDKPTNYVKAMQEFRLRLGGVSTKSDLQAEFANCVRHAALIVSRPEDVVWQPSVYFFLSRRLHEGLGNWF